MTEGTLTIHTTVETAMDKMGGRMKKSELIKQLAQANPHLLHGDVERVVAVVLEEITNALAEGNRVEIRGFGSFSTKERSARIGRNPKTGEAVNVSSKYVPHFKAGKGIIAKVNGHS